MWKRIESRSLAPVRPGPPSIARAAIGLGQRARSATQVGLKAPRPSNALGSRTHSAPQSTQGSRDFVRPASAASDFMPPQHPRRAIAPAAAPHRPCSHAEPFGSPVNAAAPRVNPSSCPACKPRQTSWPGRDEARRSSIRPGGTHGCPCPTPKPCPSPKSLGGTPAERLGNNRSGPIAQQRSDLDLGIKPHCRFGNKLALLHVDAPDQPLELWYRGTRHR